MPTQLVRKAVHADVACTGDWETDRPMIMDKYGWERCNSEVLIRQARFTSNPTHLRTVTDAWCVCAQHSTTLWQDVQVPNTHDSLLVVGWYHPRPVLLVRSIAIFCACLAMSFGMPGFQTLTCISLSFTIVTTSVGIEIVVFSMLCRFELLSSKRCPALCTVGRATLRSPSFLACC